MKTFAIFGSFNCKVYFILYFHFLLEGVETPTKCPLTHPYAFKQGRNCCKTNMEDTHIDGQNGISCNARHPHCDSTCNGSELSLYSNCCEDGAFVRCPDGKLCENGNENMGEFKKHCS